jgi:ankyrin repeat protein
MNNSQNEADAQIDNQQILNDPDEFLQGESIEQDLSEKRVHEEDNKLLLTGQQQNAEATIAIQPKQPAFTFPKIVDVFAEIANHNYLPMFKLLRRAHDNKTVDVFEKNDYGFNIFHLLICTSNYRMVKVVLENFPKFAFEKSKSGQTNLMLALNQSNFDIIRFIEERSHEGFGMIDSFGFDIFMYMVRNNSIILFFYFLQKYLRNLNLNGPLAKSRTLSDELEPLDERSSLKINLDIHDTFDNSQQDKQRIFSESIFNMKVMDNNGCTLVHWAAFRDAQFLAKFLFRVGCDMSVRDRKGYIPIERAVENNAVKTIHFFNSFSKYPFQSYYFLFNRFNPVEFDMLPSSYSKIESCYESEVLRADFQSKRGLQFNFTIRKMKYLYSKYNLKYKFGISLYSVWTLLTIFYLISETRDVLSRVSIILVLIMIAFTSLLTTWFNKLNN